MPVVYENEGHRRRMIKYHHQFAWKILEWRRDPHCRKCDKLTHMMPHEGRWQDQATVDHVLARCLGGSDTEDNFELLCSHCNQKKSKTENRDVQLRRQADQRTETQASPPDS